ncbi:hypothetical protein [Listeria seeligeri]|uniref:hypothetical protein n=1 Tax=Listeria seeligeri TaxID=1640 RepID=UPI0022EBAEC3|nr:hypothetical protein [Listeria seeligeri]
MVPNTNTEGIDYDLIEVRDTGSENYHITQIQVVVNEDKISKQLSKNLLDKVINQYEGKANSLSIQMRYAEGAYSHILVAQHNYDTADTTVNMSKYFNDDR